MDILIVDDNPANLRLLQAILEAEGHGVIQAADGEEALKILLGTRVDAVISDILMPRMDGYRLCYEVRANERLNRLPFIFYTSTYTSDSDQKLALGMGADGFLTKPSPVAEILAALHDATSIQRSRVVPTEPLRELNLMKEYNQQLVAKLEHKNDELSARNEELSLLGTCISNLSDIVMITEAEPIDEPGPRIVFVNEAFERITGYTIAEAIGRSPRFLQGELTDRPTLDEFREALVHRRPIRRQIINYAKDGSRYWLDIDLVPIYDQANRCTHFAAIERDITERKRAEEIIAEQAALLDKATDAIIVRELDGGIAFWNRGAEKMYGWTRGEVIGRNIGTFLYADPGKFEELNALTIRQGEWTGEVVQRTKDGRELVIEARWTVVRDTAGQPKSVLAINTDITERKKVEAQFMRAQRMECIGTLAGGIAHDLNNILLPIMMSIEMLKTKVDSARNREILETIEISARRGADIVRQVLSFARGMEGARVKIQLKHILKDLEKIIQDAFPKNIRMHFYVPQETWTILCDPTQIHQVLLNLCVNARDAMPNGGTLDINVKNCELDEHYVAMKPQMKPGRYVNIDVTDSGTGIPPEIVDKIFEPFFTTKELNKGTGLGLSTVMAIVKNHDGFIDVESEPGRGTSFRIYLHSMDGLAEDLGEADDPSRLPRGHGETILIVDDEAAILTITSETLQAFGYWTITATNGADALATYAQHQDEIDLVLTDLMMPVLDGAAMIHALVRINPNVKVVATSGLNAADKVAHASAAGVRHFLTKPYSAGTLLKMLRAGLDE